MSGIDLNSVIEPLSNWHKSDKPLIIAGPCSAETPEQLMATTKAINKDKIDYVRAGVWKPRTRPNTFEGKGTEALQWIADVKKETGTKFAIEVASAAHVEEALKYGIDLLWIGARSTVSPFVVQEIAEALEGTDMPVLVKNPINPDNALWIGALERLANVGITKLGAIHRGFSTYEKTKYRNQPQWALPIELMRKFPHLPIISDPSHIGGSRDMIPVLSQRALDLDFDGLIIETHIDPDNAWSDAKQQVTPEVLNEILDKLKVPVDIDASIGDEHLETLRAQINALDQELIDVMAQRMQVVDQIGTYKKEKGIKTVQVNRWTQIYESRQEWAEKMGLSRDFAAELFKMVHAQSVKRQENLIEEKEENA